MSRTWPIVVALVALVACDGTPAAPPPVAFTPSHVVLDGISLGDRIGQVMTRSPYDKPCGDRSIEDNLYRAVTYCGDPKAVIIADGTGAIRELGWVGGTYFAGKVTLPVKVGDPVTRAVAVWGEPHDTFDLYRLHVDRMDDIVSVLSDHRTVVGFVFGDMPMTANSERWKLFDDLATSAGR